MNSVLKMGALKKQETLGTPRVGASFLRARSKNDRSTCCSGGALRRWARQKPLRASLARPGTDALKGREDQKCPLFVLHVEMHPLNQFLWKSCIPKICGPPGKENNDTSQKIFQCRTQKLWCLSLYISCIMGAMLRIYGKDTSMFSSGMCPHQRCMGHLLSR
jgi:hypothetical protein